MPGARILVVEDEPAVLETLKEILETDPAGYDIEGTLDGRSAVRRARQFLPQCVLLDLMLGPGPGGLDICESLRRDEALKHVGVIIVTGKLEMGEEHRVLLRGADLCLHKAMLTPVMLCRNVARLLVVVRRRSSAGTLRVGPLTLRKQDGRAWLGERSVEFTAMQFDLLWRMACNLEQVQAPIDLHGRNRSESAAKTRRVIRVQISRVRRKLGEYAGMIRTARRRGYRMQLPRER